MNIALALLIGGLYAAAVYLLLRRSLLRVIFGIGLLGHATNLLVFAAGGLTRDVPPIVPPGETTLSGIYADPLPQALVLTAIVIGFGMQAFVLALFQRAAASNGVFDSDALGETTQTSRPGAQ
jgi:multicomponent Na+:H+ antiporter subunit C